MIWTIEIPGWHPAPLNELLGSVGKRNRLKRHDREIVGRAVQAYGVLPATGKRRIWLWLVLGKGQRAFDPDAYGKSLLDALVASKALHDDNRHWAELMPPRFARGEQWAFITLEDVDG